MEGGGGDGGGIGIGVVTKTAVVWSSGVGHGGYWWYFAVTRGGGASWMCVGGFVLTPESCFIVEIRIDFGCRHGYVGQHCQRYFRQLDSTYSALAQKSQNKIPVFT